jgi:RNA polymerase sigma-B factor
MSDTQAYSDARVTELLTKYQRTGDARIRDDVVEHMRPLVRSVARRFAGREPQEDLESEGFVGLIHAVDRFSPERGNRFSTFATHLVAGQIRHYLRDRGHLIRRPAWLQELDTRVRRAASELEQRLQREPTAAEIGAATNLTEEAVEELLTARQAAQVMRMESAGGADEDDCLDVDPDKFKSRSYVTFELPIEDRVVLEGALEKLKELERKVIEYFYYQDCNQSEIARRLGISCNYAGYVLRNGLKHLRERLPEPRHQGLAASVLDPATGVYTGEHFNQRLAEEISRSKRYGHSLAVCCLTLPRGSSEAVLQASANTLRDHIRRADVVARTSTVEFGIIFPDTGDISGQVAVRLAERLYPVVRAPIHAAAAVYPEAGRTAEQLYGAARAAATPSATLASR